MESYVYVQITIPDGEKRSIEEIEQQTGGHAFMFSCYPSNRQLVILDDDTDSLINELEDRGYRVQKQD